jgi:superfamily I DNA and/or RNA helicase
VDGQFLRTGTVEEKRTNPIEAEAIVAEIRRRVNDPDTSWQSICVVTLNVQQQALITSLLEGSGDRRIKALLDLETSDSLIVRNLESVQGDERDVVMISTAFSNQTRVTSGGAEVRSLPLNFGPLNRRGGERRLNVAITRAKHEVHVFCSFDPEDMKLAEDPAKGLELLKEYLAIAQAAGGGSADLVARAPSAPDHHRRACENSSR